VGVFVKKLGLGLVCALALAAGSAAHAAPYTFVLLAPDDSFSTNYTWTIDSSPTPATSSPDDFFTVDNVVVSGDRPVLGSFTLIPGTFKFYFGDDGFEGFDSDFGSYFGPQLFTGTVEAPTFKTGTFALDDGAETLTISAAAGGGGVPEPASWTLMVLGFGGLGAALRQRRAGARAAA
jgi:hypothetical protein